MRKADAKTIRERIKTVARMLDIEHLLDRKPRQLSGGQQQRVALGRAIARQPQVFLLDEPLSNLDAQLRDDTRAELKQLHQQVGITTIYVTHDQVEAMTLADQIVVLNQGCIQQIGAPQTIYNQPANRMVATFLGNPSMNILQATYDGSAFQVNGQSIPCTEQMRTQLQPRQGQGFDLGIRPEHIHISSDGSQLDVKVNLVEPLGRETLIRVIVLDDGDFKQQTLNIQTGAGREVRVGDRLSLQFDLRELFVFDPVTGEALYPA
jgi:multiple sugar transport system ATP-binding protein